MGVDCVWSDVNSTIFGDAFGVNGGCWGGTYLSAVNNPCIDGSSAQSVSCGTFCAAPSHPGSAGIIPDPSTTFFNATTHDRGWICAPSKEKTSSASSKMNLGRMGGLLVISGLLVSVMGSL